MQVLPAKRNQKTPKRLLAYLKGLTNQNGEDLVNLCVSNNFETQLILAVYNRELTRTLFPAESTDYIKIKITRHRVTRDGCVWGEMPFMRMCFQS